MYFYSSALKNCKLCRPVSLEHALRKPVVSKAGTYPINVSKLHEGSVSGSGLSPDPHPGYSRRFAGACWEMPGLRAL